MRQAKIISIANTRISKKSDKYLAVVALLNGEDMAKVSQEHGPVATYSARTLIKTFIEAEKASSKAPTTGSTAPTVSLPSALLGYDGYRDRICQLAKYGSKAIFIGGYHGLGKTSIVYEVAKLFNAEVIRLQVTELLTEIDIIGGLDLKTGKLVYSEFVTKLIEANAHPEKQYFLLLDEFTRGREEALNILFPLLAEKILFINSPYSELKQIVLPSNMKVFGTGNINDKGIREVGDAEFDRWNGLEIKPIMDTPTLTKMIQQKSTLTSTSECFGRLIRAYGLSWQYGNEARILPMSHRTLIEVSNIIALRLRDGIEPQKAFKDSMDETYFVSSQAILNPNYKTSYDQIMREVL
jgi:hypothetical protein